MATHKSAIKRSRQNEKRRAQNRQQRSTLRTSLKKLEQAIAEEKKEEVAAMLPVTVSTLDKAASRGLIHKNKAARHVSRLTRKAAAARSAA